MMWKLSDDLCSVWDLSAAVIRLWWLFKCGGIAYGFSCTSPPSEVAMFIITLCLISSLVYSAMLPS